MPNIFEWYIPQRIVLGHSIGDISEQDLIDTTTILTPMLESGQRPIHLIFNLEPQTKLNLPVLSITKHIGYLRHPNFGWGVTYGKVDNTFLRLITAVVSQTTGIRNRQLATYHDALAFLQDMDESLDFSNLGPPVLRPEELFGTPF